MKAQKKNPNVLIKMLEDKKAINKCIREGGDIFKEAKKRNVKLVGPIRL